VRLPRHVPLKVNVLPQLDALGAVHDIVSGGAPLGTHEPREGRHFDPALNVQATNKG